MNLMYPGIHYQPVYWFMNTYILFNLKPQNIIYADILRSIDHIQWKSNVSIENISYYEI